MKNNTISAIIVALTVILTIVITNGICYLQIENLRSKSEEQFIRAGGELWLEVEYLREDVITTHSNFLKLQSSDSLQTVRINNIESYILRRF